MIIAVPLAMALLTAQPAQSMTIAAASDLQFALADVLAAFQAEHPEFEVKVSYGSSGNFYAQLSRGAPFDLFLSADVAYVDKLVASGAADASSRFVYGTGRLALYSGPSSPVSAARGLAVLADPAVRRVAIANPRHAPYGRAAEAALRSLGYDAYVRDKLVFGENVAQTAQFIADGGADVGIIALSFASSPALRGKGTWIEVPSSSHPPLDQGGCILRRSEDPDGARLLRGFLLSTPARDILRRYGFARPELSSDAQARAHP